MSQIIDNLYKNNSDLILFLDNQQQASFRIQAELDFKKGLLLSIASLFEKEISELLENFVEKESNSNELVLSFFRNKAIKRQYHTLFSWEGNNANSFFGVFGNDFKVKMKNRVAQEEKLENAVKAFLRLGSLRNHLVHRNFAEYSIDKTAKELYDDYLDAKFFIQELKIEFGLIQKQSEEEEE